MAGLSGIVMGGIADQTNRLTNQELRRDALTDDTNIRNRGLGLQEDAFKFKKMEALKAAGREQIKKMIELGVKTVEASKTRAGLQTPAMQAETRRLLRNIQQVSAAVGMDPKAVAANAMSTFRNAQTQDEVLAASNAKAGGTAQAKADVANDPANAAARGDAELKQAVATVAGLPEAARPAAIAKLLGVEPDKEREFIDLVGRLKNPNLPPEEKALINKRLQKLTGPLNISLGSSFDSSGNIAGGVPGGVGGISGKQQLPGGALDKIRAQLSAVQSGIKMTDHLIDQVATNPGRFGATGSVGSAAREVGALAKDFAREGFDFANIDISGAMRGLSNLIDKEIAQGTDPKIAQELRPISSGELDVFESVLAYSTARALQPEGKLLADTIKTAKALTDLRGLKSSERVADKLKGINRIMKSAASDLTRRGQQGVSGQATEPQVSPVPAPLTDAAIQDALNALRQRLGQ